jgi:hypothetical protein
MTAAPIRFSWDGESFTPASAFWARKADEVFVIGETYQLVEHHDRSLASHNHYFAAIHEGWQNLPEHWAHRLPTAEHLRKYALIKSGYADERSIVCASKAEAQRVAAFVKPMDDFAVVLVSEATVKVYTAKSQSMKAMGKAVFQESKTAVLDAIDEMVGVERGATAREAGRAA